MAGASRIVSDTFGRVAHPPPRARKESRTKRGRKGLTLLMATSSRTIAIDGRTRECARQSRPRNLRNLTGRAGPRCSPWQSPYPSRNIDAGLLLHDQVILYGFDSFDAPRDFTSLVDGLLGINEAAQLDNPLVSLDTDLE